MPESAICKEAVNRTDYTPVTAKTSGEIVQLPDGRAAHVETTLAAGEAGSVLTLGVFDMTKTTSMVVLNGQAMYWVKSTGKVSYEGDFFVGVAVEDALEAATSVNVALNIQPSPTIAQDAGEWVHASALGEGVTALGPGHKLSFDAVVEVAMAALYAAQTMGVTQGPIFEAFVAIFGIGDDAALDISVGMANGTHATDFDSVTECVVIHLNGNALAIQAESRDGTTTVAKVNTTVDAVDDTYFFLQIDARTLADVQMYIDGANVLPASVFRLDNATGPLLPIAHIEKTSNDTVADVRVRDMRLRAGTIT